MHATWKKMSLNGDLKCATVFTSLSLLFLDSRRKKKNHWFIDFLLVRCLKCRFTEAPTHPRLEKNRRKSFKQTHFLVHEKFMRNNEKRPKIFCEENTMELEKNDFFTPQSCCRLRSVIIIALNGNRGSSKDSEKFYIKAFKEQQEARPTFHGRRLERKSHLMAE